jgi:transcription elongation factor Elf1
MGTRCTLFGHVRDSTEFEERREERPNGTVLICREYQVCRRCGDREELYRNEQVLATKTDAASDTTETVDDTASAGEAAVTEARPPDPTATPAFDRSETEQEGGPENESVEAGASSAAESRHQTSPDRADAERITDDAVIISGSTADATPSAGETHRRARTDGTGDSLAVPRRSGPSTVSLGAGNDDGRICCGNCGLEWRRDDTSLREGDLCPGCRKTYVERA